MALFEYKLDPQRYILYRLHVYSTDIELTCLEISQKSGIVQILQNSL